VGYARGRQKAEIKGVVTGRLKGEKPLQKRIFSLSFEGGGDIGGE